MKDLIKYGIIVILGVIICVSLFFGVHYGMQWKADQEEKKKQIQELSQKIEDIYNAEKADFLEEYRLSELENCYEKSQNLKDDEETDLEDRLTQMQSLYDSMQKEHEENKNKMTDALNKSADVLKTSTNREYCFEDEIEKLDTYLLEYKLAVEEEHYQKAREVIQQGENILNAAGDTSDSKSMSWTDGADILRIEENYDGESQFIASAVFLVVEEDSYKGLSGKHFTVYETVGSGAPQKMACTVIKNAGEEGRDNDQLNFYEIRFSPQMRGDYTSERTVKVHIRNADGTRGATLAETYSVRNSIARW